MPGEGGLQPEPLLPWSPGSIQGPHPLGPKNLRSTVMSKARGSGVLSREKGWEQEPKEGLGGAWVGKGP